MLRLEKNRQGWGFRPGDTVDDDQLTMDAPKMQSRYSGIVLSIQLGIQYVHILHWVAEDSGPQISCILESEIAQHCRCHRERHRADATTEGPISSMSLRQSLNLRSISPYVSEIMTGLL